MNWLNVHDLEGWHPSDSSFEIEDDKREIVASLNIIFTNLTRGNRAKPVALKPISMKFLSLPPPVSQYVVPCTARSIRTASWNIQDRYSKRLHKLHHSPKTFNFNLSFLFYPLLLLRIDEENSKITHRMYIRKYIGKKKESKILQPLLLSLNAYAWIVDGPV